jgi:hypothetical protein
MKRGVMLIGFWVLAWSRVFAAAEGSMRVSKPAVRDEVVAVIEGQLAAFRSGDAAKAYTFASEGLRVQTPLPAFVRMVQRNYPEIWQNTRAELGIIRDDGARATLVVQVFAKDSDAAYDYVLFKEEAGWRIGGVIRRRASRKANGV